MLACRFVNRNAAAWADGELSPRARRRFDRHMQACGRCKTEAEAVRRAVDFQRSALPAALANAEDGLDRLWLAVVRARADDPEPVRTEWRWLRSLAIAVPVTVFFLLGFVGAAGGPQAVLVPLGIKAPPPAVARAPMLFKDYQVIQKLELLEHFDKVEAVSLDDEEGESENG